MEVAARSGAGLVLTEPIAVSAEGRITPGTPGLYRDDHVPAWRDVVAAVHARGVRIAALLGHAGARGATRPRREGVDRPLRQGGWPLVAASPLAYTSRSQVPSELRTDLPPVAGQFSEAAARAAEAGFDAVLVHMAHGYLLASFLSPLTNRRTDEHGGSLQNRMAFPLLAFEAVRTAWPEDRPAGAALLGTDWARGGFGLDDAVAVAAALQARGCDLVQPLAGQTVLRSMPEYGRFYQVPASDRIRNESAVSTMVGGNVTTADEANTVLAAGRADLVIADRGGG
jgi:anthraniloyl-CoA monooxygenase